jgi:hypothetical protein
VSHMPTQAVPTVLIQSAGLDTTTMRRICAKL